MQRQRGELVPVGEVIADLPGPVQALRKTPPPAQRGFTLADQVNQLVSASEADPYLGFMARTMALCSLPRSNPGNRLQYKRTNGPFTLGMIAGLGNKLPYGNLPRLLLAWVCTEAVRTGSRDIVLGKSLSDFMRALGVYSSSGGKYMFFALLSRSILLSSPVRSSDRVRSRRSGNASGHSDETAPTLPLGNSLLRLPRARRVTLRAQAAPRSAATCRQTASGSDVPRPAGASNSEHA